MNKKEAAEYLSVSTRAVERYTASGKLPCTYVHGRFGKEASYEQSDLDRFKAELSTPIHQPEIVNRGISTIGTENRV